MRTKVSGSFGANNGEAHQAAALAGVGIALTPSFIVGPDLASGALEELLPDYRPSRPSIYALYPHGRHLSPKVRAFVNFLAERCAGTPYWEPEAVRPPAPWYRTAKRGDQVS